MTKNRNKTRKLEQKQQFQQQQHQKSSTTIIRKFIKKTTFKIFKTLL